MEARGLAEVSSVDWRLDNDGTLARVEGAWLRVKTDPLIWPRPALSALTKTRRDRRGNFPRQHQAST